jgi:hypothetical protein
MAVAIERETSSPDNAERKQWTKPLIEVLNIHAAEGPHKGPKCDKHGSLSHGSGCP